MVFLVAAAALVLTDARFEGRASARLETRARTATGTDASAGSTEVPAAAGDAEVTPTLFGAVDNRGGRLEVSYSPTLRMRQPYANDRRRSEVNHLQTFEARWAREGRPSPYFRQNFYYGVIDLAVQQGVVGVGLGQLSQVSVDVNGGVEWPLSRLLKLDTSVGYNYSTGIGSIQGGPNPEDRTDARSFLPTQRAYRAHARLDAQATALDTLTTQADGAYTQFPGLLSTSIFVSVAERWRRQLLPSTALELGALAGVIYSDFLPFSPNPQAPVPTEADRVRRAQFAPGGDATLYHRINSGPHLWAFDGGVRVAPFVDRYLATAFNRGELFTSVAYTFRERWVSSLRGAVSRSLTPVNVRGSADPSELLTTYVEARTGYWAPRYWRVDLSGQNSTFVVGNSTVNNWVAAISLTLIAEGQL